MAVFLYIAHTVNGEKWKCVCHNHLQEFLQRVAQREPEVLRYETLRLTVHNQPQELHEASEIMKEHQLLGNQWIKLKQQNQAWGELLNRCEAAWESCLATERELCSLEEVQVQWEPPAVKQPTLAHCKEMEVRIDTIDHLMSHLLTALFVFLNY